MLRNLSRLQRYESITLSYGYQQPSTIALCVNLYFIVSASIQAFGPGGKQANNKTNLKNHVSLAVQKFNSSYEECSSKSISCRLRYGTIVNMVWIE